MQMSEHALQPSTLPQRDNCLRLEVTSRCNHECPHCFVRAGADAAADIPLSLARSAIDEARACGYEHLHITGGEPFLWEGIFCTLTHAAGAGYRSFFVNTNGTLLTEAIVEKLARYEDLALSVSLDGPQSFHDGIRGRSSYRRARRGIGLALAAGLQVQIFTIVRKSFLALLPRFAKEVFHELPDVKGLALIQLVNAGGPCHDLSGELLDPDDFIAVVKQSALLNGYGCRLHFLNNPLASLCAKLLGMPWLPEPHPLYRPGSICIRSDGKIAHSHSSDRYFGTYTPGCLPRILSSGTYLRATNRNDVFCAGCDFFGTCRSHGMLRPSERTRAVGRHFPFCRSVLNRIGLPDGQDP